MKDLTWYRDNGAEVDPAYFSNPFNHFLAFRLDGTEFGDPATSIYVAYNGWTDIVTATLPAPLPGNTWFQVADTSAAAGDFGNIHPAGAEVPLSNSQYGVAGRSVLLLIEK